MAQKWRSWVFTFNNYTEIDEQNIIHNLKLDSRYFVIGREKGESGTPHLQGYVYFPNQRALGGLKKAYGTHIHWEPTKGTHEQASDYCKKDGDFIEYGEAPVQGKRSDIIDIKQKLNETGRISSVIDDIKNVQQLRFAELYLKYKEPKRNWKPMVFWFYGDTGTGKTATALQDMPDAYISSRNLKWWEGYDGHEDVIIDDFRKDFCTFHELLRILDRYEYRIETKGSSRQLLAKRICITSCYHPRHVYDTREDIDQLLRRIDYIYSFSTCGPPTTVWPTGSDQRSGGNTVSPDILLPVITEEIINTNNSVEILTKQLKTG